MSGGTFNHIFLALVVLVLASCKVQEPKQSIDKSEKTDRKYSNDYIEKGFDYKTVYEFSKKVLLLDEKGIPVKKTQVTIFFSDSNNVKHILSKRKTDEDGFLALTISIPIHLTNIKLQYKGLRSSIIRTIPVNRSVLNRILEGFVDLFFPKAMAEEVGAEQVYYFPSKCGFGTLGFEDLWPTHGDQDFNDLVVNYNFSQKITENGEVSSMDVTIQFVASGAGYRNGFAIELPVAKEKVKSVMGSFVTGEYIKLEPNGVESGHEKAIIIISDDVSKQIPNFTNVYEGRFSHEPFEMKVTIAFNEGVKSYDLSMPPYNPFIIVNQNRGREVHLPDYLPTKLADPNLFGTYHDRSVPRAGRYYKSISNKPWAIHIPVAFQHMREKHPIQNGHKLFLSWVESKGSQHTDWYLGKEGYRNDYFLYKKILPRNNQSSLSCEDEENTTTVTIKDGAESEGEVDTIQVSELNPDQTSYEDNYSTTVSFEPFDSMNGKRELIYAKLSFDLTPSLDVVGKNIGGVEKSSAIVSSSQTALLSFQGTVLSNESFIRRTEVENIHPGNFEQYLEFLNFGTQHTRFRKKSYEEVFQGGSAFSGDQLDIFTSGSPVSFQLSHFVSANLASVSSASVSVDTNFRIKGKISIKYVWRQFGTSGVKFNDPNMEIALRTKLGVWSGGVSSEHCSGVTSLDLSDYGISDLKGLEICSDLETLNLKNNNLENIDIVSNFTKLKKLYLSSNKISSLEPVRGLVKLDRLDFSSNNVSDVSPLSNLTLLRILVFHRNSVSDISAFAKMDILETLHADWNSIVKVDSLANKQNLRSIQLRFNQLDDGTPFGTLPSIGYLNLRTNKLKNFNWASGIPSLHHLVMSDNQLSELPDLTNLDRLTGLYLDNNPISDLSKLEPVKDTMQRMLLGNMPLDNSSQLKDMPDLRTLHLNNMNINLDDLETSPLLSDLNITNSSISNKDKFNKFLNLKYLNLHGSGITEVGFLADNVKLKRLYLNHNDILDLVPVKGLFPDLERLYVEHNRNLSCASINTLWYYKFRKVTTRWNYEPDGCEVTETDPLLDYESIFSDINLSYQARSTVDKMSGDLVAEDLTGFSSLVANKKSIETLEGIQFWTDLEILEVRENNLTDLNPILDLEKLRKIDISDNVITSFPTLKSREVLEEVNISNTSIVNIRGLLDMPKLSKVTMTGLKLPCEQLDYVNELAGKDVAVEVSPFIGCDDINYILEEESLASLIQHSSTDLSSSNINYSEYSEQSLVFSSFDDQEGMVVLSEVKLTLNIDSYVSSLAKNFNEDSNISGELEISNKLQVFDDSGGEFFLPDSMSLADLTTDLALMNNFMNVPKSTVEQYQDNRSTGTNSSMFMEVGKTKSNTFEFTFSGTGLDYFKNGKAVSLRIRLDSNATVVEGHQGLLYDFDSNSNVKAKLEYKYRLK